MPVVEQLRKKKKYDKIHCILTDKEMESKNK